MNATISQAVADKATRIIAEGRIRRVKGHVYEVIGDHDTYAVVVSYPQEVTGLCKCKTKGICSHLIAACAWELTHPVHSIETADPFEGII